jgi:quinol monooxygenase YgiN
MITHIVVFKYRSETSQQERENHLAQLQRLPSLIKELETFSAGFDIVRSPRSYDVALVSTFRDRQALDAYAKHPDHIPVAEMGRNLCENIVAVDFES